jgi:ankyrin repeat protein
MHILHSRVVQNKRAPLAWAAAQGKPDVVDYLLRRGGDPRQRDRVITFDFTVLSFSLL